jgi:hypothetical protein
MRILFVHGRAQGGNDPDALKQLWIQTLKQGLAAAKVTLPDKAVFDFPFYGDKLDEFTAAAALPTPGDVIAKGPGQDRKFEAFMQSALDEMYQNSRLTEKEVEAEMNGSDVREKGPQNWAWVQAIARAIDKRFTSQADWTIQNFLQDVYMYTTLPDVTKGINAIVENVLTDEPTVVVGHSLGSVVGYKVITDKKARIYLCKYVTLGSPLGIRAISTKLGIPENTAHDGWYNAYDERDIVALNPLDNRYFPTSPAIVNNNRVQNHTDNRHGIVGYLNDSNVAAAIEQSLKRHAAA